LQCSVPLSVGGAVCIESPALRRTEKDPLRADDAFRRTA
jgi:hypothetical protein